jgi:hypothetical protein
MHPKEEKELQEWQLQSAFASSDSRCSSISANQKMPVR